MKKYALGDKVKICNTKQHGTLVGMCVIEGETNYAVTFDDLSTLADLHISIVKGNRHRWYTAKELKKIREEKL